jgi:hypothetical protein
MVKLKETHLSEKLALLPVFYLPIEIFFHEKWGRFDEIVLKVISEKEA